MSIRRGILPLSTFANQLLSISSFRNVATRIRCTPQIVQLALPILPSNVLQCRSVHSTINFASKLASTSLQLKKRPVRKKMQRQQMQVGGFFNVFAYATAEEYDLEGLHTALTKQDLYQTKKFFSKSSSESDEDVLYVGAKYQVENEPHEIFFFREGSVVLWNCSEEEIANVLRDLREFEVNRYENDVVIDECELMLYKYTDGLQAQLKNGNFFIQKGESGDLDRYTFSNAMTASVKLGIWEAALDRYVNSMEFITDDLKSGRKIKMTRAAVLQKTGELFALKHMLNLRSDLLDTPDFYWDREELERLFIQTSGYFSIQRRTKVMNDKLNHCVELAELVSTHLNDAHHIRLEWMIIILIMVEVLFEIVHYLDRFVTATEFIRNTKDDI